MEVQHRSQLAVSGDRHEGAAEDRLMQPPALTLAIGIATRGRPSILRETLLDLREQTRRADAVLVAYLEPEDIAGVGEAFPEVRFVQGSGGAGGSCAQRNHLLDAIGDDFDLVLFLDDDFYLQRDYIIRMSEAFHANPTALGATGTVLADGAKGPGLSVAFAREMLRKIPLAPTAAQLPVRPVFNTYGCNMAFRLRAVRRHSIRFDENLPAYGWYEDLDFSRRLLPFGSLVCVPAAQGVHLGVKLGRTSGRRFGYSQVANPIYLAKKGSYPARRAGISVLRNLVANLLRSPWPEPYIDRRGRLRGNLMALFDFLQNKLRPDRILTLR